MRRKLALDVLRNVKDKPLSDTDITNFLKRKNINTPVILYKDLYKFKNVDELLSADSVILLYETEDNSGHWVTLIKSIYNNKKCIEFFDPYGGKIDVDQLKYIDSDYLKSSRQANMYLSKLLLDAINNDYIVTYNHIPFQKFNKYIKTCGRWCVLRIMNQDMDLDTFRKCIDIQKNKYNISSDELVSLLILENQN